MVQTGCDQNTTDNQRTTNALIGLNVHALCNHGFDRNEYRHEIGKYRSCRSTDFVCTKIYQVEVDSTHANINEQDRSLNLPRVVQWLRCTSFIYHNERQQDDNANNENHE